MNIILYGAKSCPKCKVLKDLMQKKNIKFEYKEDAIEEVIALNLTSIPWLSVDGVLMDFSDSVKWVMRSEA